MSTLGPASHIITHRVQAPGGGLHVIDQPGAGPPVVLLHGFPDDSRIYHRLMPHLAPHRAAAFDFLGYGHSDRAEGRPDPGQHEAELAAVLDHLGTGQAILVGHDAGGPVAVNVTLDHPHRVSRLVLINSYYGTASQLRLPEMIRLFADQNLAPLADAMTDDQRPARRPRRVRPARFTVPPMSTSAPASPAISLACSATRRCT
jgi:haloalkane dehalogenase